MRALLVAMLLASPLASDAAAAPRIALYTMGPGEELFSTFGHAAICVDARCYNYGTADFRTPLPLTWSFIRGRARFWVSVLDVRDMLGYYASVNRAVWRQELPLTDDEATRLGAALEASTDERVKYYRYHHFDDNCTTRIRDLVDRVLDSRLHRDPTDRRLTFREWARAGFAESWPLQIAVELLLGRPADRRTDSWLAMFLPSQLRAEVASRLGAPPVLVVPSTRPPPGGAPWLGALALGLGGLLLGALVFLGGRAGFAVASMVVGLIGLVLWSLFVLSSFPELRQNENLLLFWPSDLFAGLLPRRYLDVRLVVLALVVLLHLGLLLQPLWPILFVAPPFLVARFRLQSKA